MVLLGVEGELDARFGPFGYSANLHSRSVRGLRGTYHRLGNRFGRTRWNSYVTWVMWNLIFVHLEIVLVLVQDMCVVCAKRTISSEIVLDALDGTPR